MYNNNSPQRRPSGMGPLEFHGGDVAVNPINDANKRNLYNNTYS